MSGHDRPAAPPPGRGGAPMTPGGTATVLVRRRGGPQRATLLELFFDVVFVAFLALTSMDFSHDLRWAGAVKAIVPLFALWWLWSITTLLTDFFDPQRLPVQVVLTGIMLGTVLATVAAPGAFGKHGLFFAAAYVAVNIGRGVVLTATSRDREPRDRVVRFLFWFGVSATPWLLGGLLHGDRRVVLWGVALAIDYWSGWARYPTPRIGRIPREHYDNASEHLGERYQQIMILAVGDMILVATLRYSHSAPTWGRTAGFLLVFASAVLLWQIYVFRAGAVLESEITRHPSRSVRWTPLTHLIMVTGVVTMSAGLEVVILDPGGTPPSGWYGAIFGGPALFMAGRILFELEVFNRFATARAVGLGVLIAASPLAIPLPPLGVAVVVAAILLGITVSDRVRARKWFTEPVSRPGPEPGAGDDDGDVPGR
ncbi:low temperature requirement protein A [Rugosimonospora acidiphila]|uniref:Low temperature requirement protein A n=1 Tax=Rugosimonospora acidiphila TaxID=556531 RepID=A0ABP9SPL8_9ACTN